ncbi:MAG: thioredoxin domain-containing protein [Steroidobacteraceae bacterium]
MKKLQALTLAAAALALALALDARLASGGAEQEPAPQFVHLKLDAREYSLGRSDASLTMLEFTDYQCPFCRRFQAETWPLLKKNYIDTGKLRFIVRDLPLQFHSAARPAAEAAHCAGEQGKFWEMHHALLTGDDPLANGGIERRAKALGLDSERLQKCMKADRYESAIARNIATADALNIHGTPAFVIGRMANGGLEGQLVEGAQPYDEFDEALKQLLAEH